MAPFATAMPTIMAGTMAAGTGFGVMSSLEEGKDLERIGEARAAIDRQNADAAMRRAREEAKLRSEQGIKLLSAQKAQFAASGIRVDTGSPLVVAAQTRADLMKDIGFILEGGETQRQGFLNQANLELAQGKRLRKKSVWDAISAGLSGASQIGTLGYEQGLWGQPGSTIGGGAQAKANAWEAARAGG